MRAIKIFWMGMLCLILNAAAQAQLLQRKVSLQVREASLQTSLQQLQRQNSLELSYLNNDLPAGKKLTLHLKNKPLQEVLDLLLKETPLTYAEYKGRIIIRRGAKKKTEEAVPATPAAAPASQEKAKEQPKDAAIEKPKPEPAAPESQEATDRTEPPQITKIPLQDTLSTASIGKPTVMVAAPASTLPNQPQDAALPAASAAEPHQQVDAAPLISLPQKLLNSLADVALFSNIEDEPIAETKPYHVGVVYPISNQGADSRKYESHFSAHLLIGNSGGIDGFETSGFGNIVHNDVRGLQMAGWFNVVKGQVRGAQYSGFVNVAGDSLRGAQFGGLVNFTRQHASGYQFGGIFNHASSLKGGQFGGILNLSEQLRGAQFGGVVNWATEVRGAQFGGLANIADSLNRGSQFGGFANVVRSAKGAQISGFGNIASNVKGFQLAGFANLADSVAGLQLSGFLNLAREVKGVQVGIINIADSVDGVPIGFLSIVKNGYRAAELWSAEDFEANAAFKIGVERFYNMFIGGYQFGPANRWGVGYGFGALWRLNEKLRLNTDLYSLYVVEDDPQFEAFKDTRTNQLNKFRILLSWQFARHFSLFAGPTYNVMVSRYQNEDGSIGSKLVPYDFYNETTSGGTNVRMWVGFNGGVRF